MGTVKVSQLGQSPISVDVEEGMTVEVVLGAANAPTSGVKIFVNSEESTLDTPVNDGDRVVAVPAVKGG